MANTPLFVGNQTEQHPVQDPQVRPAPAAQEPRAPTTDASGRRLFRWLLHVDAANTVRRMLNQGFQLVLLGLSLLTIVSIALAATAPPVNEQFIRFGLISLPLNALAFWLTRRGGVSGVLLIKLFVIVAIAVGFEPASYVDPPVVHVLFLLPALLGALFIVPWLGVVSALVLTAALTLALLLANTPAPLVRDFAVACAVDLVAVVLPIVVVATLLRHALARSSQIAAQLDAQVAERTTQLRQQIELRQRDITAIIHDLQNRMTVVDAEIEELLLDLSAAGVPGSVFSEPRRRIVAATTAVGDLVGDLRMAAQLDNNALELQRELVDLEQLSRRVINHLSVQAEQIACSLAVIVRAAPPPIIGDPRRLERVLANLIGNAIKYSQLVPPARRNVVVIIDGRAAQRGVELLIEDTGPGLDAAALARLGTPFTRLPSARGTQGMGLGVYISQGIVVSHGGRLSFSSPGPDRGTQVRVWLPVGAPPSDEHGQDRLRDN